MDLRDADHPRLERMQVARDDRLQRADRMRHEQHRVLAGVGHRGVRALAGRDDLEDVEGAHERPGARRDRAERQQRPVVHPVDRAHRKSLEQPLLDHHPAAALVLLGGLEDEVDGAAEIRLPREHGRRAQQHRRVAVVAAGVHLARDRRCVRDAGLLVDVQCVEIGAQADRVAAGSAAQHADHAGAGKPRVHFEPERAELVGDEGGGRRLLERGLRVGVDVVAPGFELGNERGDFGNEIHGDSAAFRMDEARC